jgi:hypothetical protein
VFTRLGDRLFLGRVLPHTYPDETRGSTPSDAVRVEDVRIRPDGYVKAVVTDHGKRERTSTEYADVPVDADWEPVPGFGD